MKVSWIITITLIVGLLIACSQVGGGASKTPASVQVQVVSAELERAHEDLTGVGGVIPILKSITDVNVDALKAIATAIAKTQSADQHIEVAATQSVQAEKTAKASEDTVTAQAKKITALEANNPAKFWINLSGVILLVTGIGGIIASIFIAALNAIPMVRSLSVAAIAFGCCLLTIAYFLVQLYWIVGMVLLAGVIAGGIWYWTHRAIVKAKVTALTVSAV